MRGAFRKKNVDDGTRKHDDDVDLPCTSKEHLRVCAFFVIDHFGNKKN